MPLVSESYADQDDAPSYYSVAVAPASFCSANVGLADLKGKRSCHTG